MPWETPAAYDAEPQGVAPIKWGGEKEGSRRPALPPSMTT